MHIYVTESNFTAIKIAEEAKRHSLSQERYQLLKYKGFQDNIGLKNATMGTISDIKFDFIQKCPH